MLRWLTSTMCPVEMSMFVSASSSLQEDVLDREDGGRPSFSLLSDVIRPLGAGSFDPPPAAPPVELPPPPALPAILARHSSW